MPCPTGFVVKNGSKIRSRISAAMPGPGVLDVEAQAAAHGVGSGAKGQPPRRRRLAQLVARVGDEVDDDLVELVRVGPQHRHPLLQIQAHLDAVDPEVIGQELGRIARDVVERARAGARAGVVRASARKFRTIDAQRSAAWAMFSARVADGVPARS